MKRKLFKAGFAALLTAYNIYATPHANANDTSPKWGCRIEAGNCIGDLRLEVAKAFWPEAVGRFRMSFFSNGEGLLETTGPKKLLHLSPTLQLHYRVRDVAEATALSNLFQGEVGRVAVLVLISIMGAFPEGRHVLASEDRTRTLEMEDKLVRVSAKNVGENDVAFHVVASNWDVSGVWSTKKPDPWPGSMPLSGWTTQDGKPITNLGEARERAKGTQR